MNRRHFLHQTSAASAGRGGRGGSRKELAAIAQRMDKILGL